MNSSELLAHVEQEMSAFVDGSTNNYISMRGALAPSAVGLKLFDYPIIGVGDASDPLFAELQRVGGSSVGGLRDAGYLTVAPVGGLSGADSLTVAEQQSTDGPTPAKPQASSETAPMSLPADWLPSGRSVISYFLPLSERVRESNRGDGPASPEWLHTRLEGRMFVLRLGEHLERLVRDADFEAICPACHPDVEAARTGNDFARPNHGAWSEKRAAYVCGLGTFSQSSNFITRKGSAGLFGSIIVSAELPATERDYEGLDDYCIRCGACAKRCPAGAISAESGWDGKACHAELAKPQQLYPGYHGCGKCQVDVPCECTRPERA